MAAVKPTPIRKNDSVVILENSVSPKTVGDCCRVIRTKQLEGKLFLVVTNAVLDYSMGIFAEQVRRMTEDPLAVLREARAHVAAAADATGGFNSETIIETVEHETAQGLRLLDAYISIIENREARIRELATGRA